MEAGIFRDVIAYISTTSHNDPHVASALSAEITRLGAKCLNRITESITHVIHIKGASPIPSETNEDADAVTRLYDRLSKVWNSR
jgi:hypothetical protein